MRTGHALSGWPIIKKWNSGFPLEGYHDNQLVGTNAYFNDSIPQWPFFSSYLLRCCWRTFNTFESGFFFCHLLASYFTIFLICRIIQTELLQCPSPQFHRRQSVLIYRGTHPALCAQWLLIALYFLFPESTIHATKKILLFSCSLLVSLVLD